MADITELQKLISIAGTKSNLEGSLTGTLKEFVIAKATDTGEIGIYDGSAWVWYGAPATPTGKYRQFLYTVVSGDPTFLTDSDGVILTVALDME